MKITKDHWMVAIFFVVIMIMPTTMVYAWKHPNYSEPTYITISGQVVGKRERTNTLILDSYQWSFGNYFGVQVSDEDFAKYQIGDWYQYNLYVPPEPIYPKTENLTMDS